MTGKFMFFWSVLVPALMVIGSIIITYALYRHFAGKIDELQKEKPTEKG
jgi:nucleoside recognition membrane protein YjiH